MAEMIPFAPEQGNTCVGSVFAPAAARSKFNWLFPLVLLASFSFHQTDAWEDTCKQFKDIYTGGKEVCEQMFGDSFKYETDEEKAFTMWWFGSATSPSAPNRAAAAALNMSVPQTCGLEYFHKDEPSPESDSFTECLPWKDEACCHDSTVTTGQKMKEAYGEGYEWDRCGPMSQECERFFVQEACFYECDPFAGQFRKCTDSQVAAAVEGDPCHQNTWEMYKMPIKASYCDAWFDACRNDYFCSSDDGNFFSCDAHYWKKEANTQALAEKARAAELTNLKQDLGSSLSGGVVAAIVIGVVVVLGGALVFIVCREKKGRPVFLNLERVASVEDEPLTAK